MNNINVCHGDAVYRVYKKIGNFEMLSISQIHSCHKIFDKYRLFGHL